MKEMYDVLRHYGEIIADQNHQTIKGDFIRFTTFKYNESYYVVTMFKGNVFMVAEKEDIRELVENADYQNLPVL